MVLSYLIRGTFWLTAAGLITRTAGFFYKIFLSRIIGAEEIGLFQLCMPLYTFCLAAASGGIQTALSRFIAETEAKKNPECDAAASEGSDGCDAEGRAGADEKRDISGIRSV